MFADIVVSPVVENLAALSTRARRQGWLLYPLVVLVVLAAWLVHSLVLGSPWFPTDDPYIVAHNAQVLHWGHDPNYQGTPALAGTTSPVHLVIVSLLLFVLPPLWALDAAGWLAAVAYALGIVHLARVKGVSTACSLALVVAGLTLAETPHQLTNGLETGLMLAAFTWAVALLAEPDTRRSPILSVLCGLMPYIRPDLAPAAVLLFGASVIRHRRVAGSWRSCLRPIARDVALALLAALPWLLWFWSELGTPYPLTVGAKRYYFAEANLPSAYARRNGPRGRRRLHRRGRNPSLGLDSPVALWRPTAGWSVRPVCGVVPRRLLARVAGRPPME